MTFFGSMMIANNWSIASVARATRIKIEKLAMVESGVDALEPPEAVLLSLYCGCQPAECHLPREQVGARLSQGEQHDPWVIE